MNNNQLEIGGFEHNFYGVKQIEKINKLKIPSEIYLKSADVFDDKHIISEGNDWVFDYSGSRLYIHFKKDKKSNRLLKYILFHYASTRSPASLYRVYQAWSDVIEHCNTQSAFNFQVIKNYLECKNIHSTCFFFIIFGLKVFCTEEFPGFTIEDYEDLEFIARPHSNGWGVYQEIDNVLDPLEKNMISKGLFEIGANIRQGKPYSRKFLRNVAILGLIYVTGARPAQLAKLAVRDLRIDTRSLDTGLIRYSILLPYAKQRRVTTERLFLAIPPEIGGLIPYSALY